MRSLVDDVKDRTDIVEFISGYLKLTPAGSNFRGLCPFHKEKTPSFMVSREKQIFHCFGCAKGGDIITFAEEMEGLEFKEALKMLAEKAGLDPSKYQGMRSSALSDGRGSRKEILFRILESTTLFFENALQSIEGKEAYDYYISRGLKPETIKQFRLGYSPRKNNNGFPTALFDNLKSQGFSPEEILESGSVFQYQSGNSRLFMDRFKGRAIFPIFDSLGRPVGFSARVLPGDTTTQGKYVNTPQTLLYDKGSLLYGFHLAKPFIREEGEVILLEGNLDVVLSHQVGVNQAVATCGTALSKKHLQFLRRYTKRVVLAFDGDMAGVKATKRGAELAWEDELDVKVISLKVGTDVADIAKEDPEKWKRKARKSKSVLGYFFDLAFKKRILSLDQKKSLADRLIKMIAKVPSEVEKSHFVRKLSEEVQVPENFLFEKLKKEQKSTVESVNQNIGAENTPLNQEKGRKFLLEERIVGLIFNYPKLYFVLRERMQNVYFKSPEIFSIWKEVKKFLKGLDDKSLEKVKSGDFKFESRNLELEASKIAIKIEKEMELTNEDDLEEQKKELLYCLDNLLEENLQEEKRVLVNLIKTAEKQGDKMELKRLFEELNAFNQKIKDGKNKS